MSRWGRDDEREASAPAPEVTRDREARAPERPGEFATRSLEFPRGPERRPVSLRDRDVALNEDDIGLLATVGAFRVVDEHDLVGRGSNDVAEPRNARYLVEDGLLSRESVADTHGVRHVLALTNDGKSALEALRAEPQALRQAFYAGVVKPRELAHDSQLYRVFEAERARLEAEGARVLNVQLDYELKARYQVDLNRSGASGSPEERQAAFAHRHEMTVVDGHVEFPDLRIEYETAEGIREHRDVELVTEHYSRSQLSGKARAGFVCYRAGGGRGGKSRRGGTPHGSRLLERLT